MPEFAPIDTQTLFARYHDRFLRDFLSHGGNERAFPRIEEEFRAALGTPVGIPDLDERKRLLVTGVYPFLDEAGSMWRAFLEGRLSQEGPSREAKSLYSLWRLYRETYSMFLRTLYTNTSSIMDPQSPRSQTLWQFSKEAPLTIFKISQNAEEAADKYLRVIAEKLKTVRRDTVEHALVTAQLAAIAKVRSTVVEMNRATDAYLRLKQGDEQGLSSGQLDVLRSTGAFENEWFFLANPLGWADRLSQLFSASEVMLRSGFSVYVPRQIVPQIEHANPPLLLEAMDRLFLVAANNGIPLEFSWNGRDLVVASPTPLNKIYADGVVNALVSELGGRWEKDTPSLPGRIRQRLTGWIPHVRKILIPLEVTNPVTIIVNQGNLGSPLAANGSGHRQAHSSSPASRHDATNAHRRVATGDNRGNVRSRMAFRPTIAMRPVRGPL